jgi:phosphoribosyl-ATP pyrophosphohydrolase
MALFGKNSLEFDSDKCLIKYKVLSTKLNMTEQTKSTKPNNNMDTIKRLADVVDARRADFLAGQADPSVSYIAKLFSKGDDAILKKIGEEAAETVMAAKDSRFAGLTPEMQAKLVGEIADLWFHCFVALSQFNLRPEDVIAELERREGVSGIAEKAARKS